MFSQEQMTGKRAFWFVILTFALNLVTWGLLALNPGGSLSYASLPGMVFYALGGLSPTIITFVLVKIWGKTKEEKAYFKPIFRTACGWKATVCVTLLFCAVFFVIALFLMERIEPWYMLAAAFPISIVGGGLEEIGWRGFLQPALEKKMPFWLAAPVVGMIWGAWHIPLWFIPGMSQGEVNFISYLLFVILGSFILASLRQLTNSVAACICFHAWINVIFLVFSAIPILNGDTFLLFMGLLAGFAVAATAAAYIHKKRGHKPLR